MSDETHNPSRFPIGRGLGLMVAVVGSGLALAAGVLAWVGALEQLSAAAAGAGVSLTAAGLALVPMRGAQRRPVSEIAMRALAGSGLRLIVTVGGAAALLWWMGIAAVAWTVGWYVVLMGIEVWMLVRYFEQVGGGGGERGKAMDEPGMSVRSAEGRTC